MVSSLNLHFPDSQRTPTSFNIIIGYFYSSFSESYIFFPIFLLSCLLKKFHLKVFIILDTHFVFYMRSIIFLVHWLYVYMYKVFYFSVLKFIGFFFFFASYGFCFCFKRLLCTSAKKMLPLLCKCIIYEIMCDWDQYCFQKYVVSQPITIYAVCFFSFI